MHPLWHLIPAATGAVVALATALTMAHDITRGTTRLRSPEAGVAALCIVAGLATVAVSVGEVLL
jgi:hypothetical protein